ncbi:MAG: glutamate 5-kinase, partial [Gammaproteobacteria bacterium]|nr:glutamate 5-kinase [Gammaproteobacteria bacterium]
LQAAAAVGQMGLVRVYESCFQKHGMHAAQILLTHDDLSSRDRYLNARSTLCTLLDVGIIPVVNENDTVATEEIRLGDNDTLAGMVTNLVAAGMLVVLTDQEGLYRTDPRNDPLAELIRKGKSGDPKLEKLAGGSGVLGRGGMRTKIHAAELAARSGAATIIASGRKPEILLRIAEGQEVGTLLLPTTPPLTARKRWLAGQLKVKGKLFLDAGAVRVLQRSGRSLLAVGVTSVKGRFVRGELVSCLDPEGKEVARGLVNYSAAETRKLMGLPSEKIESVLEYVDEPELIHRDNLVCVG